MDTLFHNLPSHWQVMTLGDLCAIDGGSIQTGPFGSQLHASDYVPVGIPTIMPKDIGDNRVITDTIARISPEDVERLKRHKVKAGDIIYSRRGDVERRALIRADEVGWLCGTGCMRIRFGAKTIDPVYASYYLGHPDVRQWIVRHAIGATMPNLNTSILSAIPFVVPPIDEQKTIGETLSAFDDKIELNRQMNQTLEAMARAIFQSWFADFDPVRAKAAGRATGLPAEIAGLFPDGFEESPLGEVPKGWKWVTLAEAMETNPARPLKKDTPAPYLDMQNMPTSGHCPLGWVERPFGSGTRFMNGDTLVARITPCLENGKTAYIDFLADQQVGWGSTEYIVLRPKPPIPPEFAYFLARDERFRSNAIQSMTGTSGRQRVQISSVQNFMMPLAPERILKAFGGIAKDFLLSIKIKSEESKTLEELRDSLLPKLMSGELQVAAG